MDRNTNGKLEAWYSKEWNAEAKVFCPNEDYISDKLELPWFEMYLVAHCAAYYGKDAAINLLEQLIWDTIERNADIILSEGITIYDSNENPYRKLKI